MINAAKPEAQYNHKIVVAGGLPIGIHQDGRLAGGWMEFGEEPPGGTRPFLAINSHNWGGEVQNYVAYSDGATEKYHCHRMAISVENDRSIRVQFVTLDEGGAHAVNSLTLDELNDAIKLYRRAMPTYA